ncbi:unnamed protein product [Penicillium bialowiezense]
MDQEMKQFLLPGEATFAYCTPTVPETCVKAFKDLDKYLETEEPYDGVIAFSLGTTFVMSWMVKKYREKKQAEIPFKVGIFFSSAGWLMAPHDSIEPSVTSCDPAEVEGIIDIPTAHIWGSQDSYRANAEMCIKVCKADVRSKFIHEKGHGVPASAEDVISTVQVMNRAMATAQGFN